MTISLPPRSGGAPTAPLPTNAARRDMTTAPPPVTVRPWWRDLTGVLTWSTMLFVVALWVYGGDVQQLNSLASAANSLGRLTGLVASDLLLIQVLMMARVPMFERAYGQDELARRHRLIGFTSFNLMWAHIVLVVIGYASAQWSQLWSTIVDLVLNYPAMLLAVAGTVALCLVVSTSVKKARGKLRYESWHLIHLYGYLGAGLALPHQLWTGTDFMNNTAATAFWWGLWAVTALAVLVYRVGLPLWTSWRHDLRVAGVDRLAPDVVTVTVTGRDLHRLPVSAGQFFQWRFAGRGQTRAHPYSLSHAPDGRTLRITAQEVGDGTDALASLRPGTRALVEGPYGRMHDGVRTKAKVLLMGSGIGVTPLRAMFESIPAAPGDVTLIYRAGSDAHLLWADELQAIARHRGARVFFVTGRRAERGGWLPQNLSHLDDVGALRHLVPDVAQHDVFVCGSNGWMNAVEQTLTAAGVPDAQVHIERFSY